MRSRYLHAAAMAILFAADSITLCMNALPLSVHTVSMDVPVLPPERVYVCVRVLVYPLPWYLCISTHTPPCLYCTPISCNFLLRVSALIPSSFAIRLVLYVLTLCSTLST